MRAALTGGAYQARSVVASAQRCVNLYPEPLPQQQQEPAQVTHFPTPGLTQVAIGPKVSQGGGEVRALYYASNHDLFAIIGVFVYYVSPTWALTQIGALSSSTGQVRMTDNTLTVVIVDGDSSGYTIDLTSHAFARLTDAAFYGANWVDYIDTYLVFNKIGTPQFYISNSLATTFNPLYFANKSGNTDYLVAAVSTHREVWLIGERTTEIWTDTGAADFPFEAMPGAFIEHGCAAKFSIAKADGSIYWVSQDLQGQAVILRGSGYQVSRVSTFAIEYDISGGVVSDAFGYTYQQQGHLFYVLTLPTQDKTFVFDVSAGEWHQRGTVDSLSVVHRHRSNCCATVRGQTIVGDYATGALYVMDPAVYTDAGAPITRIRSFPHMQGDGRRVVHRQFVADMETGTSTGDAPLLTLRWSDDRGATYGNPVSQSMGVAGQALTQVQWRNLGMCRDRVYEVSWSSPYPTAFNGAFVDLRTCAT